MSQARQHWDQVHSTNVPHQVGWYRQSAGLSLQLIQEHAIDLSSAIIDIGSGSTPLVADLLHRGYHNLSTIDISAVAIDNAKQQVGMEAADQIQWYIGDITQLSTHCRYRVWHDRAVFHFLTQSEDQQRYREVLQHHLDDDGIAIIATFAPDGPTQCSGLNVVRYSAEWIGKTLGPHLHVHQTITERHATPGGQVQSYNWFLLGRQPI